jgi:hypothetical protein
MHVILTSSCFRIKSFSCTVSFAVWTESFDSMKEAHQAVVKTKLACVPHCTVLVSHECHFIQMCEAREKEFTFVQLVLE